MHAPDWLTGVWRRRSIIWPDGTCDDAALVFWLQAGTAFADIQRPAAGVTKEGFAGFVALDTDVCAGHRQIDIDPLGLPDTGRLQRVAPHFLAEENMIPPHVEEPVIPPPCECMEKIAGMKVLISPTARN